MRISPILLVGAVLVVGACGRDSEPAPASNNGMVDAGGDAAAELDAGPGAEDAALPDAEPLPGASRDDIVVLTDDIEIEFTSGYAGRVAFNVPEDALSVVVSIVGDAGVFYTLSEWKNGDGSVVIPNSWISNDEAAPSLCLSCPNRIASSEASFAALLPNNESAELVPGTHNISMYAYAMSGLLALPLQSGTATLRVVAKLRPSVPERGILDINFHFTGAAGLTAASAPEDPDFQASLEELQQLYATAGIELGTVTYTDIPSEFRIIESVVVPKSDLQEMFALSRDQPRPALNVFIVEELLSGIGNFGVLLGVSGGIPGPPMAATLRSGVAIATKRSPEVQTAMFKVLGHEMGHHLGLFHTSEQNLGFGPVIHDPIGDTAENDASFLMFNTGEGTAISVTQAEVMRSNPWIRHEGGE